MHYSCALYRRHVLLDNTFYRKHSFLVCVSHIYTVHVTFIMYMCTLNMVYTQECVLMCRFAYDGLKTQRLTVPMVKDSAGQLQQCSWEEALMKAGWNVRQYLHVLIAWLVEHLSSPTLHSVYL